MADQQSKAGSKGEISEELTKFGLCRWDRDVVASNTRVVPSGSKTAQDSLPYC